MLKSKIESLLFISAKPMSINQLADLLKKEVKEVEQAGDELVEIHKQEKRGVQIIKNGKKFQMVSSPENAKVVQEFIKDETTGELTRPSLEALTVIAYRGPISKLDLERIRGVNCSLILRNLLIRGLIEQKTNKNTKENYYNVTFDFLRFLGVNDVHELPDYDKLHEHESLNKIVDESQKQIEDGLQPELANDDLEQTIQDDGAQDDTTEETRGVQSGIESEQEERSDEKGNFAEIEDEYEDEFDDEYEGESSNAEPSEEDEEDEDDDEESDKN